MGWRGKVAGFGILIWVGLNFPAHGDDPFSDCENWLAVTPNSEELSPHFYSIQKLAKRNLRSSLAKPHYQALLDRAKAVLEAQGIKYRETEDGGLEILPGAESSRPLHKVASRLGERGVGNHFNPKYLLQQGYGGLFDPDKPRLELDFHLITGELDDLIMHELRHYHHFRQWRRGLRPAFDFSIWASGDKPVSRVDEYGGYFSIEELDAYKFQLMYLFREVQKHAGRWGEPQMRPFLIGRSARINDFLATGLALSRDALGWHQRAIDAVDSAIGNFNGMEIREFADDPGNVALQRPQSRIIFYAERHAAGLLAVSIGLRTATVEVVLPEAAEFFWVNQKSRREAKRMLGTLRRSLERSGRLIRAHLRHFEELQAAMRERDWPKAYDLGAYRIKVDDLSD